MIGKVGLSLVLLLAAILAFWIGSIFADDEEVGNAAALRSISEKQNRILQELDEIKSELQIVKIRVSSR